jgi:toxin ParE1/3/4
MTPYKIAPQAREDLKEIYRYLRQRSKRAEGQLRGIFLEKFRLLATQPLLGEARNELAENLRMFTAGKYVILYRAAQHGIEIAHIVHSARDIVALLRHRH